MVRALLGSHEAAIPGRGRPPAVLALLLAACASSSGTATTNTNIPLRTPLIVETTGGSTQAQAAPQAASAPCGKIAGRPPGPGVGARLSGGGRRSHEDPVSARTEVKGGLR